MRGHTVYDVYRYYEYKYGVDDAGKEYDYGCAESGLVGGFGGRHHGFSNREEKEEEQQSCR